MKGTYGTVELQSSVPKYPSSSFVVFFFITFRLPRRRPPETTMVEVSFEGWGASMGLESSAESGGSSGALGMGSSGEG